MLMKHIADLKNGGFFYIQKPDQIELLFTDVLGGLFSVIGLDVKINVKLNNYRNDSGLKLANLSISKTYGDKWETVQAGQEYNINLQQL